MAEVAAKLPEVKVGGSKKRSVLVFGTGPHRVSAIYSGLSVTTTTTSIMTIIIFTSPREEIMVSKMKQAEKNTQKSVLVFSC